MNYKEFEQKAKEMGFIKKKYAYIIPEYFGKEIKFPLLFSKHGRVGFSYKSKDKNIEYIIFRWIFDSAFITNPITYEEGLERMEQAKRLIELWRNY